MSVVDIYACREQNARIMKVLKTTCSSEAFQEDVMEFIKVLQNVLVIFNRLLETHKTEVENADPVILLVSLAPFVPNCRQGISASLTTFEKKVTELHTQGRLIRFITNNRLRKQIDSLSAALLLQVSEFESEIRRSSPPITRSSSLQDFNATPVASWTVNTVENAEAIWSNLFGSQTYVVKWEEFAAKLRNVVSMNDDEGYLVNDIIDHANTGTVNRYKFVEFLRGFGPVTECIKNVVYLDNSPWFHGFLSLEESTKYLEVEEIGAFVVRFSSSKPGNFSIDYVGLIDPNVFYQQHYSALPNLMDFYIKQKNSNLPKERKIVSVLIESIGTAFKVKEGTQEKVFKSVHDIVKHYAPALTTPLNTSLSRKTWFHGDINAEEAEDYLKSTKPGTFLIRFSSQPGCYASSYVDANGVVCKSLIKRVHGGFTIDNNTVFRTLQELVDEYHKAQVFLYPFKFDGTLSFKLTAQQAALQRSRTTINPPMKMSGSPVMSKHAHMPTNTPSPPQPRLHPPLSSHHSPTTAHSLSSHPPPPPTPNYPPSSSHHNNNPHPQNNQYPNNHQYPNSNQYPSNTQHNQHPNNNVYPPKMGVPMPIRVLPTNMSLRSANNSQHQQQQQQQQYPFGPKR